MKYFEDINFDAVWYSNNWELVPFNRYWKAYTVFFLSTVGAVLGSIFIDVDLLNWVGLSLIVGWFYFLGLLAANKSRVWKKFASDNGWAKSRIETEDIPPGLRGFGANAKIWAEVSGSVGSYSFKLFENESIFGGDASKKRYSTVLKVQLSNFYPHILLDSLYNKGGAVMVNKKSEEIQLEGDFHENYLLYVEPEYRIDALSLITPDIMQTMMSASKFYDVEIFGNSLYIYDEGDKRSKKHIKDLFYALTVLTDDIEHKSRTFKPITAGNTEFHEENMKYLRLKDLVYAKSFSDIWLVITGVTIAIVTAAVVLLI